MNPPAPRIAAESPAVTARLATDSIAGRHRTEALVKLALLTATLVAALPALAIVGILLVKGAPALSWEFLFEMPLNGMTAGGIFPAIVGTIWLVGVSLLFAVPVGVLAGIYLSEYAGESLLARLVDLAIINLAGVPSIVHALFGLGAFVMFLEFGASILSAGLTLGVMTLPVIITSTKAALRSVPHTFRVACWNLGITRWQTIRHVVLPNALPGILTGVILQVSRAAGETAPILFTGAAFYLPILPRGVFSQTMALSMHVFVLVTQVPNVSDTLKYGTALVLVGTVLLFNSFSIALRLYLRQNRKW
ncbi:MAG: phosphate ABC transporter permease PstA [Deltaproteobacteria bacterium]|nr:phosphate ABC transporter permease PstA [Deltaproteobacteria bacterium]